MMAIVLGLTYMQFLIAFAAYIYFKFLDYKIGDNNDTDAGNQFVVQRMFFLRL